MAVLNEINFGIHKIESMFFNNHKVHDVFYGIHHIWTEAATGIISILKSVWADEYSSSTSDDGIVLILYQPTVTHSFSYMQGMSTNINRYNSIAGIVELTDNNDDTYTMSKFVYFNSSHTTDLIDSTLKDTEGNELYYFRESYNSAYNLESWGGQFEAGKSYALSVIETYEDYRIATGTKTALVGSTFTYHDWQFSNMQLVTLKKSTTGIYGEIVQ